MNILIWLMRASRWSRRPPSARRVRMLLAVIALGLAIVALEWFGLWPEWAQMDPRSGHLPRIR